MWLKRSATSSLKQYCRTPLKIFLISSPHLLKVNGGQNIESKFMQVEVAVKCMGSKFGEHGLSGFGDLSLFVSFKFPFNPFLFLAHTPLADILPFRNY